MWVVTTLYVGLLIAVCSVFVGVGLHAWRAQQTPSALALLTIAGLAVAAAVWGVWLYCPPRRYALDATNLRIVRMMRGDLKIPYHHIRSARRRHPHTIWRHTIRCGANGGVFGYVGWFTNSGLGDFHAYATRRDRAVSIELKKGDPVVVSPDEPKRFVRALRERIRQNEKSKEDAR